MRAGLRLPLGDALCQRFDMAVGRFGETDLPRAAVKQTDAETIFKILNLRADRTGRNPKLPRRGRETARLCDLHAGGYARLAVHENSRRTLFAPVALDNSSARRF